MLRYIKSNKSNEIDYGALLEENRDKVADALVELAADAFGSPQMDLYIYPNGDVSVFTNVGGNSWLDTPHFVVWNTHGFEYATPTDGIYNDDLVVMFKDYAPKFDAYLKKLATEYDYDSVKELIRSENIDDIMRNFDESAYDEMIADIISNDYDYSWANEIIDLAVERADNE